MPPKRWPDYPDSQFLPREVVGPAPALSPWLTLPSPHRIQDGVLTIPEINRSTSSFMSAATFKYWPSNPFTEIDIPGLQSSEKYRMQLMRSARAVHAAARS